MLCACLISRSVPVFLLPMLEYLEWRAYLLGSSTPVLLLSRLEHICYFLMILILSRESCVRCALQIAMLEFKFWLCKLGNLRKLVQGRQQFSKCAIQLRSLLLIEYFLASVLASNVTISTRQVRAYHQFLAHNQYFSILSCVVPQEQ